MRRTVNTWSDIFTSHGGLGRAQVKPSELLLVCCVTKLKLIEAPLCLHSSKLTEPAGFFDLLQMELYFFLFLRYKIKFPSHKMFFFQTRRG